MLLVTYLVIVLSLQPPVIRTYLETFPFPFYIVLREIETLPMVLGQALKQWFELVHNRTSTTLS